jgi:hypothetical protein
LVSINSTRTTTDSRPEGNSLALRYGLALLRLPCAFGKVMRRLSQLLFCTIQGLLPGTDELVGFPFGVEWYCMVLRPVVGMTNRQAGRYSRNYYDH